MRVDLSIRKAAQATIRENLYNVMRMLMLRRLFISRVLSLRYHLRGTQRFRAGVKQGETRGGAVDDAE
jgi:hypothetical protein